jgi:acyl dehydratase
VTDNPTGKQVQLYTLDELEKRVGEKLGSSSWIEISQARIQLFADATDDHQWIHLDEQRATESPFGSTIAHGYLTLSLVPRILAESYGVQDKTTGINYGVDRVRFLTPVKSGSSVCGHVTLAKMERASPENAKLHLDIVIDVRFPNGTLSEKPACLARVIVVAITGQASSSF